MKKITLLTLSLVFAIAVNAQEDYNRWTLEAGANMNKGFKGYSSGYNNSLEKSLGGEFTARYMINNKFGLQVSGFFSELKGKDSSLPFTTEHYGVHLEGVANLGNILGFREWTQRFNVLGHAGAGVNFLNPVSTEAPLPLYYNGSSDATPMLIAGITPQLRLTDRVSLYADVSFQVNWEQDYAWDTNSKSPGSFIDAGMATISAGIQVSLGKNKKHADWIDTDVYVEDLVVLDNRIQVVEGQINDLKGSVEGTQSDVIALQSTAMVDANNNGVDDAVEKYVDERIAGSNATSATAKGLLNNGYVNVYFKFNSSEPETYSLDAINYLIKYMNENPSSQAELIGYSDAIGGDSSYNNSLSEKRAKRVHDILVAAGISADRLSHSGAGMDDSVDKSSGAARQLVRRVTFKLK